jgi:alpha-glucosidase
MSEGWPCWAISNHDVRRAVSRWGGDNPPPQLARMLVALVCSLRGSVCLYQGEELGLPEAEVPYEALRDPYGMIFWPNFKGRDGCRTPMPWTSGRNAGFSDGTPWLPVPEAHIALNVAAQEADPGSTLHATRHFLAWRKAQPALVHGSIRFLDTPEPVLAFVRMHDTQCLLVAFNLSSRDVEVSLPGIDARPLEGHALSAGALTDGRLRLPAYGAYYGELAAADAVRIAAATAASGSA